MTILVTGASGFIGSFIVERALANGFETWAAVRRTSSKRYLQDGRIHFIELDFDSGERLRAQLAGHTFDYVVHAAGATKCKHANDFYRVNTDGTRRLVNALLALSMPVKKFIFVSSLSVFGACRETEPYEEIKNGDTPRPNTHYGKSKLLAEQYLESVRDKLNYTILRPTGVYGPREKDYFMMIKSIAKRTDFAVGLSRQVITFVYVTDLVNAVFLALNREKSGGAYFVSDGESYDSRDFSRYIKRLLGIKGVVLRFVLPVWIARIACSACDVWGRMTGKVTALNNDKFHILAQRNWLCDVTTTMAELGFAPEVKLEEGVEKAIDWYKKEGWL
ncbi:MAG: NAD(P)-dependent oxidoreductase [Prevotella sp.]|nr:NAD(P)-dependent oxidoreductase [Prevotella sp.]